VAEPVDPRGQQPGLERFVRQREQQRLLGGEVLPDGAKLHSDAFSVGARPRSTRHTAADRLS